MRAPIPIPQYTKRQAKPWHTRPSPPTSNFRLQVSPCLSLSPEHCRGWVPQSLDDSTVPQSLPHDLIDTKHYLVIRGNPYTSLALAQSMGPCPIPRSILIPGTRVIHTPKGTIAHLSGKVISLLPDASQLQNCARSILHFATVSLLSPDLPLTVCTLKTYSFPRKVFPSL
jgi:hypothetical protein